MGQDRPAGAGRLSAAGRPVARIGALGDIHGAFDAARQIIARHPDVPFWLCVGDIASDPSTWLGAGPSTGLGAGTGYEPLGAPVYWIHGNNDNFDAIAAGDLPPDLHHIANGTAVVAQGFSPALRIAGLGGTFAPTWYETPAADLPHPKKGSARATELADRSTGSRSSRASSRDDKRRHFVRDEVEACKRLRGVDVFLTHEAPKPFHPFPGGRGPDAGKVQVNEILAAMRPRLHLFGHHHRYSEQIVEGVRSIGLDLAERSYLLIDAASLDVELLHASA
ncbi:MAG TPA: metallophosphoesterase [Vicinamibacterales bacterium]|nr:metallophosphoesterase [Vicinamibacterales bacterium]